MKLDTVGGETRLLLDASERELLRLALLRASFEDTPPEQQRAILDFAAVLLDALRPE